MKSRVLILFIVLLAAPALALVGPSERFLKLVRAIPPVGEVVPLKVLGITVGSLEKPVPEIEGGYNFRTPADLDRRRTDTDFKGRFPGLHLNLPLQVVPGDVNALFISDQPERITDERKREDGSVGATGVYARARMPGGVPIRLLVDHTDGTKRPLRVRLIWIAEGDGTIAIRRRGEFVHADSVRAGQEALARSMCITFEPRAALAGGVPFVLSDVLLTPDQTFVSHAELASTVPGELLCVVSEADAPAPPTRAALDALPVLHSIVWVEEAERLVKFLDPKLQPTRFARILESFQHARGGFPQPDRLATTTYDVSSWQDSAHPLRIYSLYESIPGHDPTTPGIEVDNRGKYGANVGLRIAVKALPPGSKRAALLVFNPYAKFGGRHFVSDGKRLTEETLHLPFSKPGMIDKDQAATLWVGTIVPGDALEMWTEPMANASVYLWYAFVPLPD